MNKKILVVKPTFSVGNVGDLALIKTLKYKCKGTIIMPNSKAQLKKINATHYDSLIYFGNDCVPYYTSCIPIEKIKEFLSQEKKVHVINTSWGTNPRGIPIIRSVASNPNFQIYMRDKYSHILIQKDIKFNNTPILTADLGFLCKKNNLNNKIDKLEVWINSNDKPIIGINTHNDFKEYNYVVKKELKKFMEKNKDKYRYMFIPHDSRKNEYEDLVSLCKSCNNIDGFTTDYMDPEYEKYITSKLYCVITGRMHLSILTIPNSIPAIPIAYNGIKAKGSCEHYGLEDLVMEPKNISKLDEKIKYVEDNYEQIQNKINSNKEKVEILVNKMLDNL